MAETTTDEDISTGVLLFLPFREMERRVFDFVVAAGYDDITLAQSRLFQRISPGGSRLTDLAEQARITKQSAGFLVDQLERAGYVERVRDPDDARARLVRVAQRGARVVALAAGEVERIEAEWTAHVGAEEMAHLRRVLLRLREITDPYA
ncbi:MarR family winged helix-turn-helix transcriptional regulator [Nocardiopsis aegyptia]|uniref:DNA-binding MarR family transcriptional regulator n=1 Tax=Nocardiopsis aegyptia TaxID=220378 RepID=A0A7Z0JAI2_9ACTN|nr:MarR family transcriptional regulator [Nocardiopsis aegyptia]NYJ35161.1 DNA-binding MarR family transcriptional regulator [Nocardiopsis aegyptia]